MQQADISRVNLKLGINPLDLRRWELFLARESYRKKSIKDQTGIPISPLTVAWIVHNTTQLVDM